jgi:hypothetical protein
VTRDHALLAVELATRLGTTPELRAAFAPVVWRARAVLKSDVTRVPQVSVLGSDVPRGAELGCNGPKTETPRVSWRGPRRFGECL